MKYVEIVTYYNDDGPMDEYMHKISLPNIFGKQTNLNLCIMVNILKVFYIFSLFFLYFSILFLTHVRKEVSFYFVILYVRASSKLIKRTSVYYNNCYTRNKNSMFIYMVSGKNPPGKSPLEKSPLEKKPPGKKPPGKKPHVKNPSRKNAPGFLILPSTALST